MDFSLEKVGKSIWPEVGAVAGFLVARMGATYIKEANALTGWKNPEYYLDGVVGAGSLYMIGAGKAESEAKAVLWAETGLVGQRAFQKIYDSTIGKSAKKIGRGKIKGAPRNPGQLSAVEQAAQIAAAQERAIALRTKQPAAVGGYTEF